MAKTVHYKRKLPILARLLLERSDDEHPISRREMQEELERWGLSAERKSIYDDMEQLRELGLDVQARRGKNGGWYIGARDFELAELKLLVDAVQSSRFLTERKSDALIRKLEGLTSVHQARQLQRQVYVDRRVKTMNESIFYNVDRLQGAIAGNRAVTFRYFEYNAGRERVFRRAGERYRLTPYGLIWDSENYYLAGWDELHKEVRHYRVDKMADIFITGMKGRDRGDWDPEGYARRHFGMYAGRPCPPAAAVRKPAGGGGHRPLRAGGAADSRRGGPFYRRPGFGGQSAAVGLAVRPGARSGGAGPRLGGGGILCPAGAGGGAGDSHHSHLRGPGKLYRGNSVSGKAYVAGRRADQDHGGRRRGCLRDPKAVLGSGHPGFSHVGKDDLPKPHDLPQG